MSVDLGNALIGIVLSVELFDEYLKELAAVGALPDTHETERDGLHVTVHLEPPDLVLVEAPEPHTRLRLHGTAVVRQAGEPDGPPVGGGPFDVDVLLSFELTPVEGEAPVLTLAYEGVAEPPPSPVEEEDVDDFFEDPDVAAALGAIRLDLLAPAVAALEGLVFADDEDARPARDEWPAERRYLPAGSPSEVPAIGLFVAAPSQAPAPVTDRSVLPARTGLGLVYSRTLLDLGLGLGAQQQVGTEVEGADGATITSLTMKMLDDAILIDGKVERSPATVVFKGPIFPELVPGTIEMHQDTSQVDVDVQLPWWARTILFLRHVPLTWPVFIPAALISEDFDVWRAAREIGRVPGEVRGGLADALAAELVVLAQGLEFEAGLGTIELDGTPDHSRVENGHLLLFAQVFVSTLTETIVDAFYSRRRWRFVQYRLESGRLFRAQELARLVDSGKVVTPGFHAVHRSHMRANPDDEQHNNLSAMFGDNLARPPY